MKTEQAISIFLQSKQAKGLSTSTIRWYQCILNLYAQQQPKLTKRMKDIEQFISSRVVGDERRHGYYRALKCFYRFLYKRFKVVNPVDFIEPPRRFPKQPKPLTPDEIDQLLSYPHKPKIKSALLFLIDTGARVSEAADLQASDIIETVWGYVVRIKKGKTGTRLVPICIETYQALINNLPWNLSEYKFRRTISQSFKDAHVKGSGLNLRHTFATLWEGDELILQQIMGHSHLSTTQIYRAMRTERMSKQHQQYSPLKMVYSMSKSML